jgi:hypothetical protein
MGEVLHYIAKRVKSQERGAHTLGERKDKCEDERLPPLKTPRNATCEE